MIRNISIVLLLAVSFGFLNQSCNDAPTSIPLIKDTTSLYYANSEISNMISSSGTESYHSSLFQRTKLFVGQLAEYKSVSMLRFQLIPENLSYLTSNDIISVKLVLFPDKYQFGDLDNPVLEFDVMNLVKEMDDGLEWEDIYDESGSSDYFDENSKVSFKSVLKSEEIFPKAIEDTAKTKYEIDIPKETVLRWFYLKANYSNDPEFQSEYHTNFQLAIVPTENSNIVQRFNSASVLDKDASNPRVEVKYLDEDGKEKTVYMYKAITYSFNEAKKLEENTLSIQNGFISRIFMDLDLSSVPVDKAIVRTELRLVLDESKSKFGSIKSDKISGGYYTNIRSVPLSWTLVSNSMDSTEKTFTFPKINSIVESYLYEIHKSEPDTSIINNPLKLSITNSIENGNRSSINELFSLNRLVFYGQDATDPKNRPIFKVIYSDRVAR